MKKSYALDISKTVLILMLLSGLDWDESFIVYWALSAFCFYCIILITELVGVIWVKYKSND